MMKISFAILGMGNRGYAYASKLLKYPNEAQITAIADTRSVRLEAANKYLNLPQDRLFDGADAIFSVPKLADVMIVSTQDSQHREHAIRAMELGYDLLLEKPISNKLEDIVQIAQAAKRFGRRVLVCHVLRYTVFYKKIKELIARGVIGKVETVQAMEKVGYYHIAHSYVRGNWHKEADSSPMILAKCSHDMDILTWLTGKDCVKINSFGSLDYFREENAPEGATERCQDCKLECPFHAQRFYLSRIPGWPSNILHPEPTEENILEVLRTTDYGKCVFHMDNDVVDHQTVNMLLEDGVTVTFQMTGFNNQQTRTITVMGTEGEIWGDFHGKRLYWQRYGEELHEIELSKLNVDFSGHGGGDEGLVYDAIRYMRGDDFDTSSVTTIERSVQSHYMSFAAERSRVFGGELIRMDEFIKEIEHKGE